MDGKDEGLFSWFTVNFLFGNKIFHFFFFYYSKTLLIPVSALLFSFVQVINENMPVVIFRSFA